MGYESLAYDEIKVDKNVEIEYILNTSDVSNVGFFVEVDLKYPDELKEKTKNFSFAPENKRIDSDNSIPYMKEYKPITYTQKKKILCDWTDKKAFFLIRGC